MSFKKRLKELVENSDIKIEEISKDEVAVILPYDTTSYSIEIEGKTVDEKVESFILGVNEQLEQMINHLEDCKL